MGDQRDEAFLVGQAAGIIAVMSALVQAQPATTRKRMLQKLRPLFDSLTAAMRSSGATEAQIERKGAEWVRDLFISQIAEADKKTKTRASPAPPPGALDIEF